MEILGVFGGWGVPFPLPPSCIKGGPGAESQAGTNREQSKHEQTVNKSATIARRVHVMSYG